MYSCIVLSFFELLAENLLSFFQGQQVRPQYAVPWSYVFFERFTHAKNSSKSSLLEIFFLSSNFISLLSSSISFSIKLSTSHEFFVMKLYEKCFESLLSPCTSKFTFTPREDFFILFQFLILFILITPIV